MKSAEVLVQELEDKFGNPLGPRQYDLIKEAIDMIRFLNEENKALISQVS